MFRVHFLIHGALSPENPCMFDNKIVTTLEAILEGIFSKMIITLPNLAQLPPYFFHNDVLDDTLVAL